MVKNKNAEEFSFRVNLIGTQKSPPFKAGMNAQRLSAKVPVADQSEKKPRALARGDSFIKYETTN